MMTSNRATPRKHAEWSLLINALVEIRHNGKAIRTGFVEDARPDSSALWLTADAANPRQMFEAAEGHQVWVTPQELSGDLKNRMTARQIFCNSSGTGRLKRLGETSVDGVLAPPVVTSNVVKFPPIDSVQPARHWNCDKLRPFGLHPNLTSGR